MPRRSRRVDRVPSMEETVVIKRHHHLSPRGRRLLESAEMAFEYEGDASHFLFLFRLPPVDEEENEKRKRHKKKKKKKTNGCR